MSETKGIVNYEDVVNFFLAFANDSGEPITNLKLQKLLYYSQAWYLANFKKPLFDEEFEAWVHGPVLPKLYHKLKERGSQPIPSVLHLDQVIKNMDPQVAEFLTEVAQVYMPRTAYELELMTHNETPWIEARKSLEPDQKSTEIISKSSMRAFYGAKVSN